MRIGHETEEEKMQPVTKLRMCYLSGIWSSPYGELEGRLVIDNKEIHITIEKEALMPLVLENKLLVRKRKKLWLMNDTPDNRKYAEKQEMIHKLKQLGGK